MRHLVTGEEEHLFWLRMDLRESYEAVSGGGTCTRQRRKGQGFRVKGVWRFTS